MGRSWEGLVINNDESPRLYDEQIAGISFACLWACFNSECWKVLGSQHYSFFLNNVHADDTIIGNSSVNKEVLS